MQIQQMMEIAKVKQAEIEKQDWRTQLAQLRELVKEISQRALDIRAAINGEWVTIYGQKQIGGTHILQVLKNGQTWNYDLGHVLGKDFVKEGKLLFNTATILQTIETKTINDNMQVEYEATLKIDELAFLRSELPQMNVPIMDPDYTLCKITITIPRCELIKEAIHTLNTKLEELAIKRQPKPEVAPTRIQTTKVKMGWFK